MTRCDRRPTGDWLSLFSRFGRSSTQSTNPTIDQGALGESRKAKKALFLEAGTGWNTPGIIKYSFWQMTHDWPQATYACLNLGEAYAPEEIRDRSICINGDVGSVLRQL